MRSMICDSGMTVAASMETKSTSLSLRRSTKKNSSLLSSIFLTMRGVISRSCLMG